MLCLRPVFVLGSVPLFGISRHFYPLKNVSVNVVLTFRPTSGGPHWLMAVSVLVNNRLSVLRCWVHMRRRNDEVFLSKQVVCRPSRTMTNPFTFLLRCSFPPTCWKCALHNSVHFTEHIFWFICLKGDRLIGGTVQPERVFYYRRILVLSKTLLSFAVLLPLFSFLYDRVARFWFIGGQMGALADGATGKRSIELSGR